MKNIESYLCALSLLLAELLAWAISFVWVSHGHVSVANAMLLCGLWVSWFALLGHKYFMRQPFWSELLSLIKGISVLIVLSSLAGVLGGQAPQIWHHVQWGLALLVLMLSARAFARSLLQRTGVWARPAIIFGAGENAQQAALALKSEPGMGFAVEAFMVPAGNTIQLPESAIKLPWPEKEAEFDALIHVHCVIALEASQSELRDCLIRQLSHYRIKSVSVIPSMRGVPLFGLETTQFFSHEVLMLHLRNNLTSPVHRLTKRVFDVIGASCLILLLSPLMLWVAYKISRSDGVPVIFSQPRVGKNLKTFKFYKFRSMVENAEDILKQWEATRSPEWLEYTANNFKLANDPRLISIGALIRRTSIDELPQLFNVIMGDMSLVGPRPLLPREINDYGEDLSLYGQTPPGITGLWQVSGRSQTTFEDRVAFDTWYVKNWSIWTDITILFKTWSVVFKRKGAY